MDSCTERCSGLPNMTEPAIGYPSTGSGPTLHSLNRVLDVLEALHTHGPELGVTELANILGTSKGSMHGILSNLEARGYVRRSSFKRYQLGIKLWELGFSAQRELGLQDAARPYMEKLTETTGESTHLSLYDNGAVLYLDKVSSPYAVQAYTRIGGRAPAYCVATGKALLAFQAALEIRRVGSYLTPFTNKTIATPEELRDELVRIRHQGFATNEGEWRADVVGVAAPIWGFSDSVLAAIGVSGPDYRFPFSRAEEVAPDVSAAASAIGGELGATPHPTRN